MQLLESRPQTVSGKISSRRIRTLASTRSPFTFFSDFLVETPTGIISLFGRNFGNATTLGQIGLSSRTRASNVMAFFAFSCLRLHRGRGRLRRSSTNSLLALFDLSLAFLDQVYPLSERSTQRSSTGPQYEARKESGCQIWFFRRMAWDHFFLSSKRGSSPSFSSPELGYSLSRTEPYPKAATHFSPLMVSLITLRTI